MRQNLQNGNGGAKNKKKLKDTSLVYFQNTHRVIFVFSSIFQTHNILLQHQAILIYCSSITIPSCDNTDPPPYTIASLEDQGFVYWIFGTIGVCNHLIGCWVRFSYNFIFFWNRRQISCNFIIRLQLCRDCVLFLFLFLFCCINCSLKLIFGFIKRILNFFTIWVTDKWLI